MLDGGDMGQRPLNEKLEKSLSVESNDSVLSSPLSGKPKMTFDAWNNIRISLLGLTKDNYKDLSKTYIDQFQELLSLDLDYVEPILLLIYESAYLSCYSHPVAGYLFEDVSEDESKIDDLIQDEIQSKMQKHLSRLQEKLKSYKTIYGCDTGICYLLLNLCKLDGKDGKKYQGFIMLLKAIFEKFVKLLKTISLSKHQDMEQTCVVITLLSSIGCFLIECNQSYDEQLAKDIAHEFRQLSIRNKLPSLVLRHMLHFLEVYRQGEHSVSCWCASGCFYSLEKDKWLLGGCDTTLNTMIDRKLSFSSSTKNNKNMDLIRQQSSSQTDYGSVSSNYRDSGTEFDSNLKADSISDSSESLSDDAFHSVRSNSPEDVLSHPSSMTPPLVNELPHKSRSPPSIKSQFQNNNTISYSNSDYEEVTIDANSPSEEIFIPKRCFNRVIGYERSVVRKIEAESGAMVWTFGFEVPRPETTNLTAHRLVAGALGVSPAMDEEKLKLEKEKLDIAKFNNAQPGRRKGASPLKLTGTLEQIRKAKDMIQKIVRNSAHLNILIPSLSADDLTRRLGLKLQSIESLLSVCVEINTDANDQLCLDIFGDKQSCKDAKSLIVQHLSQVTSRQGHMVTMPDTFMPYLKTRQDSRIFVDRLSKMCGPFVQLLFMEGKPSMFIWGQCEKVNDMLSVMTKLSSKLLDITCNDSLTSLEISEKQPLSGDSDCTEVPSDEKPPISDIQRLRSSSRSPDLPNEDGKNVFTLLNMLENEPTTPLNTKVFNFSPKKHVTYTKDKLLSCFNSPIVTKEPSWFSEIEGYNDDYMRALLVREGHGPDVLKPVMAHVPDASSWRRKSSELYSFN